MHAVRVPSTRPELALNWWRHQFINLSIMAQLIQNGALQRAQYEIPIGVKLCEVVVIAQAR